MKFYISWNEPKTSIVEGKDEDEAMENFLNGEGDEVESSVSIDGSHITNIEPAD